MENFSEGFLAGGIKRAGGIFLAAGDGKTSFISVRDIAAVALAAFEKPLSGQELDLTGPEALDHAEAAKIVSDASGRMVAYHVLTEEQMVDGARGMGMPEPAISYLTGVVQRRSRGLRRGGDAGCREGHGPQADQLQRICPSQRGGVEITFREAGRRDMPLPKSTILSWAGRLAIEHDAACRRDTLILIGHSADYPTMNRLYYGDNLDVLRGCIDDESVDLIYLDPPFNSQATYNVLFKSTAGEKSRAQIEAFEDTWHWGEEAELAFDGVMSSGNTDAAEMLRAMRSFLKENDMMAYLS